MMNAVELHAALKIPTSFKEWAAEQIKAGKQFKPFFGILSDGKLGRNYTLSPELEAELVGQYAPEPIVQPTAPQVKAQPVKPKKKKPAQAAPRDETPYSVLAYNEIFFGRTLNDRAARRDGIALAHIAKLKAIEPGKQEHPVWQQVNTWPKYLLDKFYQTRPAKKASLKADSK